MHRPTEYSCVLVTAPSISVARKLAAVTLKERLVACANLIPKIESHYWWQGQLESSSEVMIFFKTSKEQLPALQECVIKNHPYDTPEFVALDITEGSQKYFDWITSSLKKPS
jgi:periplasmic divalent cation tolerance protein